MFLAEILKLFDVPVERQKVKGKPHLMRGVFCRFVSPLSK
jgi:hypothetical protein